MRGREDEREGGKTRGREGEDRQTCNVISLSFSDGDR